MNFEIFIYVGGVMHLLWVVFDLLWPWLFKWKETLAPLDDHHRILLPLISKLLVVIYLAIATMSFRHATEMLSTPLGRTLLGFVAVYWLARAFMQVHYYGFERANQMNVSFSSFAPFAPFTKMSNKATSYVFFVVFLLMIGLYLAPLLGAISQS